MKKTLLKSISVFAVLTLLFGSISVGAFAAEETEPAETEIKITQEAVSLRNEYEKHFLMSDGSYSAVLYAEPVHRMVGDTWVEIDNTLLPITDTAGIQKYQTANAVTDVSFAKSFGEKLVTMKQDDFSVSWGVKAEQKNTGEVAERFAQALQSAEKWLRLTDAKPIEADLSAISAEEQKTVAAKASSVLRYDNAVAQDVDLEYIVLPSRVKESIILQKAQNISAYTFTFQTENLSARMLETREIEFFDADGETVFTMRAPYMYDAAGELSEDIAVALTNRGAGLYTVTVTPNAAWLHAAERVYPVVIDPDVTASRVRENIIDNYVAAGLGVQNRNLDRLYIGRKSGTTVRTYLKYNTMPTIPANGNITAATQKLTITSGTSTANNAAAYKVTGGDWASGTITWANMPAAATLIASNIGHNNRTRYEFSCYSAVRDWYSGSTTGKNKNYGIMVRYQNESINDYNAFYSADCATEANRPKLTIRYELPPPPVTTTDITWPVPGFYTISSPWGYRSLGGEVHRGIDISCKYLGVVAAVSGTVHLFEEATAGNAIVVTKTGSEFQTRYYHLSERKVVEGQIVKSGTTIAISGETGNAKGAHLHFQLQWGKDKYQSYNPLSYYHAQDKRSTWTNPNPMFILSNGIYVPNKSFNYTYTHTDYNDTSVSWKK